MGCIPSSTYPEHIPRSRFGPTQLSTTPATGHSGSDFVFSRAASTGLAQTGGGGGDASKPGVSPPHLSLGTAPLLQVESRGDVGADGIGLAPTTYTTSTGRRYRFQYGHPVGFANAEEVIPCLDEGGMHGNLYRLVRSKLLSIGEEEANATAVDGDGADHVDTLSESEAKEREKGVDVLVCSVTARRRQEGLTREAALQEQFVVALLGTDTIVDASAIPASRYRPRHAAVKAKEGDCTAQAAGTAPHLSATLEPLSSSSSSTSSSSHGVEDSSSGAAAVVKTTGTAAKDAGEVSPLAFDDWGDDLDYQLHPQAHYSALPAQRKPGAAVPIALCPPSRTLRVPVEYSAVEDRLVTNAAGAAGDKEKGWRAKVLPQRMFRLATSETRTWAFYNDSEYVMHVFTLFDKASKLEPRDSTRLWPSSVFDDGNAAPTPPPVFFGLFFDEDGEEAVAASEMPDSVAHRQQQRIFGTRGSWIAELLVPPRSTRMFVEGKVRGAYRMRCTRLALDDLVAVTDMAQMVARKRNARHAADRFRFSLRRPARNSGSAKPAAAVAVSPLAATETERPEAVGRGASSPARERNSDATPPPLLERSLVDVGCHSTLTESQGVLTRQTYIRHLSAQQANIPAAATAAAPAVTTMAMLFPSASGGAARQRLSPSAQAAAETAVRETVRQPPPLSAAPRPPTPPVAAAAPLHSEEGAAAAATGSSATAPQTGAVGAASLLSPPSLATGASRSKNDDGDSADTDEMGSVSDTHSSCADFARVRPDRQRHATAAHDDALLSGPETPSHRGEKAAMRSVDSNGASSLARAALPHFLAVPSTTATATSAAAAPLDESAGHRMAPMRKPRASPGAAESLSPRIHRRRLSSVPNQSGGAGGASLDGAEELSSEAAAAVWQAKVHTLTPRSSCQSERMRRAGMRSVSSYRTVTVDDWTESIDVEGDAPAHDSSVSANGGRTIPYQREAAQTDPNDE